MRSIAWLLWTAPLLAGPVHAAQVYRCTVGGSTVYQDLPCSDGGEKLAPATGSSTTAGGLAQQIADAREELRRAQDDYSRRYNAEVEATRAKLGLSKGQSIPNPEMRRIEYVVGPLQQSVRDAQALISELEAEARRRCPGGFSSGGKNGAVCRTSTR
jgi:hypothetical protein